MQDKVLQNSRLCVECDESARCGTGPKQLAVYAPFRFLLDLQIDGVNTD